MKRILVVDDEKNYLVVLKTLLSGEGYDVSTTQDPLQAARLIEEDPPDLLLTDMKMPGMTGMELLEFVKEKRPEVVLIILTAFGTVETAVEAMKKGAFHYLLKPFDNDEIKLLVRRALEMVGLKEEKRLLSEEIKTRFDTDGLIAESEPMRRVNELIDRIAPTKTTVLIEGESGTGKELVARAIHARGERSDKPFIAVNCGALPETLLETELFGHEKGAFTGADSQKKGRFEIADGGTLFLDEIGTTSSALQVRLLRVLQEQTFERVGGIRTLRVDVRVMSASNQALKRLIEEGSFREDLFYRLNVFSVELPPLRERTPDIAPMAAHFVELFSKELGKSARPISEEALAYLERYPWPGNVRELKNAMERAVVLSTGDDIGISDLPVAVVTAGIGAVGDGGALKDLLAEYVGTRSGEEKDGKPRPLPELLDELEKAVILDALEKTRGVQARAARLIGISPTSLQYKIGKYNIK